MNDLDELVKQGFKDNPNQEIFTISHNNQKMWVKEARVTGSNILHKFIYVITKNPLLTPVAKKGKEESVTFESNKLTRLHSLLIPVPKVVGVKSEYFILEDRGPIIHDLLHKNLLDNTNEVLEKVVVSLAALHNIGEFHGATQLKNLTYLNDCIYFIDFEESFDDSIDVDQLQFRDLFLFLFSLSKENASVDYKKLIYLYIELTNKTNTIEKFHKLISQVSFLMEIIKNKTIWNMLDKDTKSVYKLFKELKDMKTL